MSIESTIKDILDENTIEYRERGRDILVKCLNPAHDDSHPSMGIDKITGSYYCFSCGFGGSLNKFLALFGLQPDVNMAFSVKQETLMEKIVKLQQVNVKLPDDALPYSGTMGNCGKETMGILDAFTCNSEPKLEGRICFPITNNGRLKFIEARAIDEETRPRWIRWPDGVEINFFLNISVAPTIVLVEGYSDYANMYRIGCRNISPLFGAQAFNGEKLNKLLDNGVQKIVVFTDNDDAGDDAFFKIKAITKNKLKVVRLRPKTDPGDIADIEELQIYTDRAKLRLLDGGIIA